MGADIRSKVIGSILLIIGILITFKIAYSLSFGYEVTYKGMSEATFKPNDWRISDSGEYMFCSKGKYFKFLGREVCGTTTRGETDELPIENFYSENKYSVTKITSAEAQKDGSLKVTFYRTQIPLSDLDNSLFFILAFLVFGIGNFIIGVFLWVIIDDYVASKIEKPNQYTPLETSRTNLPTLTEDEMLNDFMSWDNATDRMYVERVMTQRGARIRSNVSSQINFEEEIVSVVTLPAEPEPIKKIIPEQEKGAVTSPLPRRLDARRKIVL